VRRLQHRRAIGLRNTRGLEEVRITEHFGQRRIGAAQERIDVETAACELAQADSTSAAASVAPGTARRRNERNAWACVMALLTASSHRRPWAP
jgi:hypothetical protein